MSASFLYGTGEETLAAGKIRTDSIGSVTELGNPIDENSSSLELESNFYMRTGREPSNEEIAEYLQKHRLHVFMTDVVMHIARHFPPDPFEFLLDHIPAMVMKFSAARSGDKTLDPKLSSNLQSPPQPLPPGSASPEQRRRVVQHIVAVLRHAGMVKSSATKLFGQFASGGSDKMLEADFAKLLGHLQATWCLQPEDSKLMSEVLKRWRFRTNVFQGTRGLPLWPVTRDDFTNAYASMLRAVRDRYVPIGGKIHRSLFIRQSTGALTDKYDLGPKIGKGAYGEVLLVALKSTGQRRVCKRVARQLQRAPHEELSLEVELLRGLDHPHIIKVFEFFETDAHLELIMEPVFGGTMTRLVGALFCGEEGELLGVRPAALTESWVAAAISQLLSALAYAHDVAGVIHKDLKCDNVLLVGAPNTSPEEMLRAPVHVMLADFGIAEIIQTTPVLAEPDEDGDGSPHSSNARIKGRSSHVGGTPSYMSPEMFRGSFTEKSDIWSLGVMVFYMLTGELPYRGENVMILSHAICNLRRHPSWQLLSKYNWSHGARWFCQQLLAKDEAMRPSAAEASQDTWLTKACAAQTNVSPTESERSALQQQHLQSHLMKMAINAITSQLNLSQLHHLNLRFKHYDASGDGRLSHVEMRQVLEDAGITRGEDTELLIESLDSDRSGMIEYSEFMAACIDLGTESIKEHLRTVFGIFDLDSSGSISIAELREVLTEGPNAGDLPTRPSSTNGRASVSDGVGMLLPDGKSVEDVMQELDRNKDEQVKYAEFERYLLAEHEQAVREGNTKHHPTQAWGT